MRHQHKGHRIARGHSHRKATLAALGNALITHKRITTTEPKAKALRVFIEPLLTRAKDDTSHNRRQVFRRLQDKETVTTLFTDVAEHLGDRNGGYTRIVKLGQRAGDGAPMAVIELVDYNDVRPEEAGAGRKRRTRRGSTRSRGKGKAEGGEAPAAKAAPARKAEEAREEAEETTGIGAQAGTAEVVAETAAADEVAEDTAAAEETAAAEDTVAVEEQAAADETAQPEARSAEAEAAPGKEATAGEEAAPGEGEAAADEEAAPGKEDEPKG